MITQNSKLTLPQSVIFYKVIQFGITAIILGFFSSFFPEVSGYSFVGAIFIFVFGVAYAYLSWMFFSYLISENSITINSGILFRTSKTVNFNDLESINVATGPVLMLMGLAQVKGFTSSPAQTIVSSSRNGRTQTTVIPDVDLILTKSDAEEIASLVKTGQIQKVQNVAPVN